MKNILPDNFTEAIGWTIFHSIWQIAVIAALLGILLIILGRFSAQLRYFIASVSYIFILGVGVYTFTNNFKAQKEIAFVSNIQITEVQEKTNGWVVPEIMLEESEEEPFLRAQVEVIKSFFSRYFTFIAMVWVFGILLLSLRFIGNLVYLQRMKNYRVIPLNKNWQDKLLSLEEKLGMKQKIQLLQSSLTKVPLVIGFIKPVILIPLSALSGLSTKEIECIIAHELAHIKRNDYFINILQKIVEILFFYHPAVWWISTVVKMERENCCDDIAISLTGDSVNFVKALANMEERRIRSGHLAVAFSTSKNQLLKRVQRILNQRKMKSNFNEGFIASCVIFLGFLTIAFSTGFTSDKSEIRNQDPEDVKVIKIELKDTTKNDIQYDQLKSLEEGDDSVSGESKKIIEKERKYVIKKEINEEQDAEELKNAKLELEKAQKELERAEYELQKAHEKLSKKERKELEEAKAELQQAQEEMERAQKEVDEAEMERKYVVHVKHNSSDDIDEIIEDAMEEIEIIIEDIDKDDIGEAIEDAMDEVGDAINDIDFDEIYEEISDAIHEIAVEIDVDEIIDEIKEGVREARYEVRTQVRHYNSDDDMVSEHMSKLTEGVDAWNEWRINSPGLIPQLKGANLYDFDLTGINFEEVNLNGAELKEINLSNANLFNAQLRSSNLKEANLSGAILREASFTSAEMKEAILKNADARHASFRSANLKEADLSDADLREADLSGAILSEAILKNTKLKGAKANSNTLFPPNFDAESEGVIVR